MNINGSWGALTVSTANAGDAAMWQRFFAKMARDPKTSHVLFVYAAGNYEGTLDGKNYYPGGIQSPNVITVGNIQTTGKRNWSSNKVDPSVPGGEVTLGAPGDQAVWGTGADGKVLAGGGGTSSATPMVTATAALVRAIDPTLTGAEIKDLITGSAAPGEAEVGGRALRADLAVRKAIDGARAKMKLPAFTDEMIVAAKQSCSIKVNGSVLRRLDNPAGATEWSITASLATTPGPTTLSLVVGGARPTNWRQSVDKPGVTVTWKVLAPKSGVTIIVTRLDNGFWVKYTLRDDGRPSASPTPTSKPTPAPKPTAKPRPQPTAFNHDCDHPPADLKPGTITWVEWMLPCGAISP